MQSTFPGCVVAENGIVRMIRFVGTVVSLETKQKLEEAIENLEKATEEMKAEVRRLEKRSAVTFAKTRKTLRSAAEKGLPFDKQK